MKSRQDGMIDCAVDDDDGLSEAEIIAGLDFRINAYVLQAFKAIYEIRCACAREISSITRKHYNAYLNTRHWRKLRQEILESRGNRCESCGKAGRLEVHHLAYDFIGMEQSNELMVMCSKCHAKHHGKKRKRMGLSLKLGRGGLRGS